MICPHCMVQMHQHENQGGGIAEGNHYETWELKICPSCGRVYKEFYSATLVSEPESE